MIGKFVIVKELTQENVEKLVLGRQYMVLGAETYCGTELLSMVDAGGQMRYCSPNAVVLSSSLSMETEPCDPTKGNDPVKHPSHYADRPVEVIDIIEACLTPEQFQGFCIGNTLKYNLRAGKKGDEKQDLEKGKMYYDWFMDSKNA